MKTVKQALIDEIPYPLGEGLIEVKALRRGVDVEEEATQDVLLSSEYIGTLADCLYSLIETPNFNEADKTISLGDRNILLKKINSLYNSIGEESVALDEKPRVFIGRYGSH